MSSRSETPRRLPYQFLCTVDTIESKTAHCTHLPTGPELANPFRIYLEQVKASTSLAHGTPSEVAKHAIQHAKELFRLKEGDGTQFFISHAHIYDGVYEVTYAPVPGFQDTHFVLRSLTPGPPPFLPVAKETLASAHVFKFADKIPYRPPANQQSIAGLYAHPGAPNDPNHQLLLWKSHTRMYTVKNNRFVYPLPETTDTSFAAKLLAFTKNQNPLGDYPAIVSLFAASLVF